MSIYDIAIIGGGFSGTMTAVNLAQLSEGRLKIALIERHASPALGLAYGTTDLQHLLNVRAGQMGAFPDKPDHFWQWIQNHPQKTKDLKLANVSELTFVPRKLYGYYLQDILTEARGTYPNLEILQSNVSHIRKLPNGNFEIIGSNSVTEAKNVVLALGNFPPGENSSTTRAENPYAAKVWQRLAEPGDVLIIGTGLTSLDLVATLARTKKEGRIHLLSRNGLLPRVHTMPLQHNSFINPQNLPQTTLELLTLVRREVRKAAQQNIPWQNVIDSMRPFNQRLWMALNQKERLRFLRFLRPYWDVHRHRCAPEIMEVFEDMRKQERIILHKGYILDQKIVKDEIKISYRPRGQKTLKNFTVRQIVNCTGPQSDIRKLDDALIQNLLEQNLITPDNLRIGLATSNHYNTLDNTGAAVTGLYALGSAMKGRLYESVAVPELRVQAKELAEILWQKKKESAA